MGLGFLGLWVSGLESFKVEALEPVNIEDRDS